MGTTNAAALVFKTNNTERFAIDASGNIVVKSFITNNSGIVFSDINGVLNKLDLNGIPSQYLSGDGTFRDIVSFSGWKIIGNDVVNNNTGNIGIGILTPQYKLDVFGDARISNNLYVGGGIVIADKVQASSQVTTMSVVADSLSVSTNTSFAGDVKANNKLNVQGNATFMGSVGLGVTMPGEKLEVVGNIKASGTVYSNFGQTDSLHVYNKIEVGNSIIIDGVSNLSPTNNIYTDDADLLIQSNNSVLTTWNTILNAGTGGGNVGIGTLSPTTKLEVKGQVKIVDGTQGANKVLTSDNDGLASWENFSTGISSSCSIINNVPKMTSSTNIGCSQIFDNGSFVGIGAINPQNNLHLHSSTNITNFQITNSVTGTTTNDGLLLSQTGLNSFLDARSGDLYIQNVPSTTPCPSHNTIINGNNNGKVGIGTIPSIDDGIKLHVKGYTCSGPSCAACEGVPPAGESTIFRLEDEVTGDNIRAAWWDFVASGVNHKLFINAKSTDGINANIMTINEDGNVGIATTSPNARLTIDASDEKSLPLNIIRNGLIEFQVLSNGTTNIDGRIVIAEGAVVNTIIYQNGDARFDGEVRAKSIHIKADVWSDKVFYDNYKLLSLNEVEEFININKHLPDVPSENEVKKNGVDQGQFNALMLQKIEELTLYIIQLEKTNKKLATEIELLK